MTKKLLLTRRALRDARTQSRMVELRHSPIPSILSCLPLQPAGQLHPQPETPIKVCLPEYEPLPSSLLLSLLL